jgi:hypothetical protein
MVRLSEPIHAQGSFAMITAGATVQGGYYLNRDAWDLVAVSGKQGVLEGEEGDRFIKLPALAVLGLAPVAGGLFVAFLPLVGFALVAYYAGRGAWARGKRLLGTRKPASNASAKDGGPVTESAANPQEAPSEGPESKD